VPNKSETANRCRLVAKRSLCVLVPALEGYVAAIAKLADAPDLGFKTSLAISNREAFMMGKPVLADNFPIRGMMSRNIVTLAQILAHRRARFE
jgi:hypothetical protein